MDPCRPYNELPPLPPNTTIDTTRVLRAAIDANRELGRLSGYCSQLPNQEILLNSIVLKEARASSEIENIVTTQDELYRALAVEYGSVEPATKEVLNYRSAMWTGLKSLRASGLITTNLIEDVQRELEQNDAGIRRLPGTALVNDATGQAIYTPPDEETRIRDLLRNLEEYLNTEVHQVDPLIRMAVAHYQFESIHPFYDGNGRTGRIINILYLIKEGLLESPILYLSGHIIGNKSRYYELLQTVRTDDDWEEWVLFMLASVESTSVQTLRTIELIADLMESTITLARDRLPRSTYSKELIELLFVQPYTKIEHLVDAGIAERRTASKYLKQLEEVGILTSFKSWKETIYINHELMALLRGTD